LVFMTGAPLGHRSGRWKGMQKAKRQRVNYCS
jgi:hypothetical protein